MKVKNVYPARYKDEAERRKAVKQTYQKVVVKLVLENEKAAADRQSETSVGAE